MGMGITDVISVGQLRPPELPYQALAWAPTSVVTVTGIGSLIGVQVLGARGIGAGVPARAGAALRRGLVIALCAGGLGVLGMWLGGARLYTTFGIAPSLAEPSAAVMRILALSIPFQLMYVAGASYLEAIQRPVASMIVMWCANVVNLALNLALVPSFGARGSAWSTVGARSFLAIAVLGFIWFSRDAKRYGVRGGKADGPSFGALLRVGSAAAVSHAVEAGAFSSMTVIAGRMGERAVASYQIVLNMLAVVFMISLGVGAATAVLVSNRTGLGSPRDATRAGWTGLAFNTALMGVCAALVFAFPHAIARAYTADLDLVRTVVLALPIAAVAMLPDGGQLVVASALRARGDNWFPTASHILAYAFVMPSIALFLCEAQGRGVTGLVEAILIASILSASVLALRFLAVSRKSS